jgi:hypothetical protein
MLASSSVAAQLVPSEDGLSSMELVSYNNMDVKCLFLTLREENIFFM